MSIKRHRPMRPVSEARRIYACRGLSARKRSYASMERPQVDMRCVKPSGSLNEVILARRIMNGVCDSKFLASRIFHSIIRFAGRVWLLWTVAVMALQAGRRWVYQACISHSIESRLFNKLSGIVRVVHGVRAWQADRPQRMRQATSDSDDRTMMKLLISAVSWQASCSFCSS